MPSTGVGSSIKPAPVDESSLPRSQLHRWERLESLLLGLTVLYWTVRQVQGSAAPWHPVSLAIALLNTIVAGLLAFRTPAERLGSWRDWLWAIPCVAIGGFFFHGAPPAATWPLFAQGLFVIGVLLACVALLSLGRSFSILPAVRTVATSGPYRWVRHPAYLGESIMALGCFAASPSWKGGLLLALVVPFVVWRIRAEEELLSQSSDYIDYAHQVRWRLLPGVW